MMTLQTTVWTFLALALLAPMPLMAQGTNPSAQVPVTVQNFNRAETDAYFGRMVKQGAFGKFHHNRDVASIDKQDVVRMNRDTLYSAAVFDLDAAPVTITMPDAGSRYMSLLIVNEDHCNPEIVYAPGRFTYTKEKVGTRYMAALVRTLVDPQSTKDIQSVNDLQDRIKVEQASVGMFEVPNWDPVSQKSKRCS